MTIALIFTHTHPYPPIKVVKLNEDFVFLILFSPRIELGNVMFAFSLQKQSLIPNQNCPLTVMYKTVSVVKLNKTKKTETFILALYVLSFTNYD